MRNRGNDEGGTVSWRIKGRRKAHNAAIGMGEISQTRAIYFANDDELDELGGALDTALPSENLANKQRKQERGEPPRGRRDCINVGRRVSGIKTVEYISTIDAAADRIFRSR